MFKETLSKIELPLLLIGYRFVHLFICLFVYLVYSKAFSKISHPAFQVSKVSNYANYLHVYLLLGYIHFTTMNPHLYKKIVKKTKTPEINGKIVFL